MTVQRPVLALTGEDLETLELIGSGLLGLVTGYRLPDDARDAWVVIPRLSVESSLAEQAVEVGELELRDPDTTPLAVLSVGATQPAEEGRTWLAGTVTTLRRPEHGPARALRLTQATNLSAHMTVLFAGPVRPADMLRVVNERSGRPIAFVAEGSSDPAESARLVGTLEECSREVPDATVLFVPRTSLGEVTGADVTQLVLEAVGAKEIIDARWHDVGDSTQRGAVVVFTGLSGAGKSTVARAVTEYLRSRTEQRVVLLDGDHVRAELASELTYSRRDRDLNLQRQAWVGARVAEAGGLAICAPIAPFASSRAAMRAKVEPEFRFLLVYVSTPIAIAEQRDRKGLYAKARAGLVEDFTGIDSPYEVPDDADLVIDTSVVTVEQSVDEVVALLARVGVVDDT